jgi:hypothetical protein
MFGGLAAVEDRGMGWSRHGDRDVAQAVELVRALRHQLGEMTKRLAWVEREDVAIRLEAAGLRRDIAEARGHIDRLQRRYLSGERAHPNGQRRASL